MTIKFKALPSQERLKELFRIEDGQLLRNESANPFCNTGIPVGTLTKYGYLRVCVDGQCYMLHRIVWKLINGADPVTELDHIDRNKLNNSIDNLRECSRSENCANRKAASGHHGVTLNSKKTKWVARVKRNGIMYNIGSFNNLEDAVVARIKFIELNCG